MVRVCVVAFSFGEYYKYAPFYIYSFLRAYGYVDVKYLLPESVDQHSNLAESLALIEVYYPGRLEVIDNFTETIQLKRDIIIGGNMKLTRWLIPPKYFNGYEYLYFGDIDFLIVPEKEDFFTMHVNHMRETDLPFSNAIRPHTSRLTGLHFIEKEKYFEIVSEFMNDIFYEIALNEVAIQRDEEVLFLLCERAFNLDQLRSVPEFRPYHGVHLGLMRRTDIKWKRFHEIAPHDPFFLLPPKDYLREQLIQLYKDPLFLKLLKLISPKEIYIVPAVYSFDFKYSTLNRIKIFFNQILGHIKNWFEIIN